MLTLRRNDIDLRRPGLGGSGDAVTGVLNELVETATGPIAEVINNIFSLPEAEAGLALQSLSGLQHQHVASAALNASRMFLGLALARLDRSGEAEAEGATSTQAAFAAAFARRAPWGASGLVDQVSPAWTDRNPSGWWIRGLGGRMRLPGNVFDAGARVPMTGVAGGVDGRLGAHVTLGASVARMTPHVVQIDGPDDTRSTNLQGAGYGRITFGASRLDIAAGIGRQTFDTRRTITDGATSAVGTSAYDGRSVSGVLEFGQGLGTWRSIAFEAIGGLQFAEQTLDGITEAGAGDLGLVVPNRRVESRRGVLGGRIGRGFERRSGSRIDVEGRAAWLHEFTPRFNLDLRFAGDSTTGGFTLARLHEDRDGALIGASVRGDLIGLRLFADTTFEITGQVRSLALSFGFGRRW